MAGSALSAACALGLMVTPALSMAATLSDNTYQTSADSLTASASDWLAASFTADGNYSAITLDVVLSAITVSGTSTLSLYSSDSSGLIPSNYLATFSLGAESANTTAYTLSGIDLQGGSSYWLVLSNSTGDSAWSWTEASDGTGTGFTGLWANSDVAGAAWFTNSNLYPLQAAVSISAVPEPSTKVLWLSTLPLLMLAHRARRTTVQQRM